MNKSLRKGRREDWNRIPQNLQEADIGWHEHQGIVYYIDRKSEIPNVHKNSSKPYFTITVTEKHGRVDNPSFKKSSQKYHGQIA